jgi:hypothetical protein
MRRLLVSLGVVVVAGGAFAGCHSAPAVSVRPNTDLLDGQEVEVRGGGYGSGGVVGVVQCPTAADSIDDCDNDTAHTLSADGDGHFRTTVFVKSRITDAHGQETDCTVAGSCVMTSSWIHGFHGLATAALQFRSGGETLGVEPNRDLTDGQTVHAVGRGAGSAKVAQCPHGAIDIWHCDPRTTQYPSPDIDGRWEADVPVYEVITDTYGTVTDCRAPGSCSMIADWIGHGGTFFSPQERPIAFG